MTLKPITRKPRERQIAAFDVQGDGERGMVAAALVTEGDAKVYTEPEMLVSDLVSKRMQNEYIYSHKLTYDAAVLISWLPEESRLLFIGEKLFKGDLTYGNKRRVHLADSCGMWGGLGLTDVAKEVGIERLLPPKSLIAKRPLSKDLSPGDLFGDTTLQEYTQREAEITHKGMALLQDELLTLGGQLKNTIAATAMDLFRRHYLDDEYFTPFYYRNQFARRAYYGGRCECFALGWWSNVNVYDFNSHYPSQMVGHDYPNPNTTIGPIAPGRVELVMEKEGCSDCTVDVPYMKYPILPYRIKHGIFYPVGVFRGVWCHNELRYAVENGVRIREVHRTLYSEDTVRPFDSYVTDLWERRQRLKAERSPRGTVYKLLLNSLYGKFGQREESGLRELSTWKAYEDGGYRKGTTVFNIMGTVYARTLIPTKRIPDYIIVPWAAYVTSYGRIALHKAMMQVSGPVLYTDTDALVVFSDLPTGKGLGELSLKRENVMIDVIAPKMYDLVTASGERFPVAKGVPTEVAGDYCTYKAVNYWKALGWVDAVRLKMAPATWVKVKKKIMLSLPKRAYKRTEGYQGDVWVSEPLLVNRVPGHY